MRVCVIDGRGGSLGSRLVSGLQTEFGRTHSIVALGTNRAAATAMKQAGATEVGVGSRVIADTLPTVDVIVASLNVVLPGAMLGEVTPEIVHAVLGAKAMKVLLPLNRARVEIVGAEAGTLETLITQSLSRVRSLVSSACLV
jgi:hypothetical protein